MELLEEECRLWDELDVFGAGVDLPDAVLAES
jgi:hypothetical protein